MILDICYFYDTDLNIIWSSVFCAFLDPDATTQLQVKQLGEIKSLVELESGYNSDTFYTFSTHNAQRIKSEYIRYLLFL